MMVWFIWCPSKNVFFYIILDLPYDRTALSKGMDNKQEPTAIRNAEWFDKNRVVFLGDSNVTGIDYKEKKVNI